MLESSGRVELCVVLLGGTAGFNVEFDIVEDDGTAGM